MLEKRAANWWARPLASRAVGLYVVPATNLVAVDCPTNFGPSGDDPSRNAPLRAADSEHLTIALPPAFGLLGARHPFGMRLRRPQILDGASLDRIDSNGPYEQGNLQVVCRFVNGWKSSGDDREFRRLIRVVRSISSSDNIDVENGCGPMARPAAMVQS